MCLIDSWILSIVLMQPYRVACSYSLKLVRGAEFATWRLLFAASDLKYTSVKAVVRNLKLTSDTVSLGHNSRVWQTCWKSFSSSSLMASNTILMTMNNARFLIQESTFYMNRNGVSFKTCFIVLLKGDGKECDSQLR